jgi:hypothetical protein
VVGHDEVGIVSWTGVRAAGAPADGSGEPPDDGAGGDPDERRTPARASAAGQDDAS